MDRALLETPLVHAKKTVVPSTSAEEAARLRALSPEDYWLAIAKELVWTEPPTTALEGKLGDFRYFPGAKGNVSFNCLDRWPADRVALEYEREDGKSETWTYGRLTDATARFAAALEDLGVTKGDRVAIYASNVPESFIAIHACYRIGAIYSVIFAGFSPSAVRDRLEDAQPKVVVVTDATLRRGRSIPLKQTLDEAMKGLSIPHVIVARRVDEKYPLKDGELDFGELLAKTTRKAEPVAMEANEPGFIIYTSGTTKQTQGARARRPRVPRRRVCEREVVARAERDRHLLVHGRRRLAHVSDLRARGRSRQRGDPCHLRRQPRHAHPRASVRAHGEARREQDVSPPPPPSACSAAPVTIC